MNRSKFGLIAVLLALAVCVGLFAVPSSGVAQDTWSGRSESLVAIAGATSGSTSLVSATSGRVLVVKSIALSADTAGVYKITDGSGGTVIWAAYLEANKSPAIIRETEFGQGAKTTSGNALYIVGPSSSNAYGIFRVQKF